MKASRASTLALGLSSKSTLELLAEKMNRQFEEQRRHQFEDSQKFRQFLDHRHPNKTRGKVFESLIYDYLRTDYGRDEYFFALDKRLWSYDSQNLRQLDIVKYKKGSSDSNLELIDIIECKDWGKPIDSPIVEQFYGKLKGLRHNQGTIYSPRGFTAPSSRYAQANGIALVALPWLDLLSTLWHRDKDFAKCCSCSQDDYEYRLSNVTWNNADYDQLRVGSCLACYRTHLACKTCDEIFALEYEPPVTLECPGGCDSLYYFDTSGHGGETIDSPVEFIGPEITLLLKLLREAEEPVTTSVIADLLTEAGYVVNLKELVCVAQDNGWIEEDDDRNYILGGRGEKIMEQVYFP